MDNLILSVIIGLLLLALLLFIILKNRKDKKDLEESIKQNYPKPRQHSNDIENSEDKHI
jgi:LPXTG-motif cell wall-anchored protein